MKNHQANLDHISIIMLETSHPGNIGAAARAMKNMGLSRLILATPRRFPHVEATARAAGADDILAEAKVFDTLDEALAGQALVVGTSARSRALDWPCLTPPELAEKVVASGEKQNVAIIFGCEQSGLSNEQLAKCHYHVSIPTASDFASLNLAQAIQVIAYELFSGLQHEPVATLPKKLASADEMEGFYTHLKSTLDDIEFLKVQNQRLMLRLRRLFSRAQVEATEVHILRGILSAVNDLSKKGK